MVEKESSSLILYVSTYPPRECGIATFTKDLIKAMDRKFSPGIKSKILAMNNDLANTQYPKEVISQIHESNLQEYIESAKKINKIDSIKIINIQHEFGIFGGKYGNYLLAFLKAVKKPVVVTFHSVISHPDGELKRVVQSIAKKSLCLVVMINKAVEILKNDYGIKTDIVVIPHGIPTVSFASSDEKEKIWCKNKIVLSSFGLMSSNKGYEYVIEALPDVIKAFPNIIYLIIGQTHPVVRRREGEKYRNFLEEKVRQMGLQEHVKFCDRYLKLSEIIAYLKATDIYISSAINPNQIVSGTLSYAMGCGIAVISTPFLHAKEAINHERGLLVEFNNPKSFRDEIIKMLSNASLRDDMGKNSYYYTRQMTWANVALSYIDTFNKYTKISEKHKLPKVKFRHLMNLTDEFGIIQFANNTKRDIVSGYTLDDNARAMIACCMHYNIFKGDSKLRLIRIYLNFIKHVQNGEGRLYNFVDFEKKINLEHWSDDSHGRAIWSLGLLISLNPIPLELRNTAEQILIQGLNAIKELKSPRAIAFTIIGLYFYNKAKPLAGNLVKIRELADSLVLMYNGHSSKGWKWFEKYLTYSNSKLSEALLYAYLVTNDKKYLNVARASLDFLISITFENGMFRPIGNNGWYTQNGRKADFDQQPIDTSSMTQTLILANNIIKNAIKRDMYLKKAITTFQWFLGNNSLKQIVYDETTGGCYDGIGESSINLNQGAESTVSYLIARLSLGK